MSVFSQLLSGALGLLLASAAGAETAASQAAASSVRFSQTDPFSFASLIQLILGLGLVIGLILLLAWLVRRMGGAGFAGSGMKVIATLPLSARERVVLVEAGGKQLLLGVAPGQVTLLASYDEPLLDAQALNSCTFAERLKEAMARRS